jgi:hypothetical protein
VPLRASKGVPSAKRLQLVWYASTLGTSAPPAVSHLLKTCVRPARPGTGDAGDMQAAAFVSSGPGASCLFSTFSVGAVSRREGYVARPCQLAGSESTRLARCNERG